MVELHVLAVLLGKEAKAVETTLIQYSQKMYPDLCSNKAPDSRGIPDEGVFYIYVARRCHVLDMALPSGWAPAEAVRTSTVTSTTGVSAARRGLDYIVNLTYSGGDTATRFCCSPLYPFSYAFLPGRSIKKHINYGQKVPVAMTRCNLAEHPLTSRRSQRRGAQSCNDKNSGVS